MSQLERDRIPRASWNAGQLIGETGRASLFPLVVIWAVGMAAWVFVEPEAPRPDV